MAQTIARGQLTIVAVNDGAPGSDAVEVALRPQALTLTATTTAAGTVADTSAGNTATITVTQGGRDITSRCTFALQSATGCTATVSAAGLVTVKTVAQETAGGVRITRTSAAVEVAVKCAANGATYSVTLPVAVSVAAAWGALKTDMKGLQTQYDELSADLKTSSPSTLTRYTSTLEQTARGFALRVGQEAVGRRNLFAGSGLRRQGEGAAWGSQNGSGLSVLGGYGGTNALKAVVACPGGAQQWVALSNGNTQTDTAPNILIPTKGAKYTLACLVRGDDGLTVAAEAFYKATATDNSSLRKTRLGVQAITFASGSGKSWQLLQLTVEVAAGAAYRYMEATFSATHTASGATKTAYFCRPMVAETDGYWGWGWSARDYDYIGGNLLSGTRRLRRTGNLASASGSWADGGYGGCTTIKATAPASSYTDLLMWTFSGSQLAVGRDYTLSFMARGTGTVTCYMYNGSDVKQTVETSDGRSVTGISDGNAPFALQTAWTRHTVHWRNTGTTPATRVIIRALQGATAEVACPKLEEGATATDWTDSPAGFTSDRALGAQLYDTGIDIKAGTIDMTADRFTLRNNAGQKSFDVDAKGNLVARSVAAETADGALRVTVADGALVATAKGSGARAYFGLRNGLPCLMFTDAMGNVTSTTDGASWLVTYQATVEVENTASASRSVSEGDLTLAVSGFTGTLKGTLTNGLKGYKLNPGSPEKLTLGTALLSERIAKKTSSGSLVAQPTGARGCQVLWGGKLIGSGFATGG